MNIFIDPRFDDVYRRDPVLLVDVGARGGLRDRWKPVQPHLRVIGFEPDPLEFEALSRHAPDDSTTFLPLALHNERAHLQLRVARDRGLTSIFEPNREFLDTFPDAARFDTVDLKSVEADALDALIRERSIGSVDFLKVDTQGSELYVLQGASDTLRRSAIGVEIEVEFTPLYKGQPLFADVDLYLRDRGFALVDLRPVYWKRAAGRSIGGPYGQIIWADALYLKSTGALRELVAPLNTAAGKAKLLKATSIAILYGYYDLALEIARTIDGPLTAEERHTIDTRLLAERKGRPSTAATRVVAGVLHRLWKRLAPAADAWSISDPRLGNDV